MKLHILIVDDHKLYRKAIRDMLANDPNIETVAEAGDGLEGLARASESMPDVVCMDVTLPRMNGIEATRRLLAVRPGIRVIAVSLHAAKGYILEMFKAGALGYVAKEDVGRHLVPAVYAALAQQTYLSPVAAAAMADGFDTGACTSPSFHARTGFA